MVYRSSVNVCQKGFKDIILRRLKLFLTHNEAFPLNTSVTAQSALYNADNVDNQSLPNYIRNQMESLIS